jgi:molybdopterin/thiamine biosynthesis adenylyltransferase
MHDRYTRNIGAITQKEQELLLTRRAAIVGCGGLGCFAAEYLARFGLGHLTLIDGDVFATSNLNRQLYSLEANLGKGKAAEAKKRLGEVRADLSVQAFDVFLNEENAAELLKGHDVIIDALDNVKTRLLLEKSANDLGIPLVHGAVEQWSAQVCVVYPGDFTLSSLYQINREFEKPSVLSFAPAFCASLQAAEAVKVLLNKESVLRKKLFIADLKNSTFDIVEL